MAYVAYHEDTGAEFMQDGDVFVARTRKELLERMHQAFKGDQEKVHRYRIKRTLR